MDIRQLRYFQAVAELGSFSRAAVLLRISQPAISRQVRKLEEELEAPLLMRHGHGVSPTDAGARLLERSHQILRDLERTKADIRSETEDPGGVISLAVPPGAGHYLVPPLVAGVRAQFPRVHLQILGGFSGYIQEWLAAGRVDAGVLHGASPTPGISLMPLLTEETFVVTPPQTAPPECGYFVLDDVGRLPLLLPTRSNSLRRHFDGLAASQGITLNPQVEVDGQAIIKALVKEGFGFSILTRGAIEDELRRGELRAVPFRPRITWSLALSVRRDVRWTPTLSAVLALIRQICRELVHSGAWPAETLDHDDRQPEMTAIHDRGPMA